MFDRKAIYLRFREGYGAKTSAELCRILEVKSSTVSQWKTGKRQVPWERLKMLVNAKGISWDWLLEGKGAPFLLNSNKILHEQLDRQAISKRFVSQLPNVTQAKLAAILDVGFVSAHKIATGKMFAPWDKLGYIVENTEVTWNWLIEGIDT